MCASLHRDAVAVNRKYLNLLAFSQLDTVPPKSLGPRRLPKLRVGP